MKHTCLRDPFYEVDDAHCSYSDLQLGPIWDNFVVGGQPTIVEPWGYGILQDYIPHGAATKQRRSRSYNMCLEQLGKTAPLIGKLPAMCAAISSDGTGNKAKSVSVSVATARKICDSQIAKVKERLKEKIDAIKKVNYRKDKAGGRLLDGSKHGPWTNASITETPNIVGLRASLADLVKRRATMDGLSEDAEFCVGWVFAPASGINLAYALSPQH